MHTACRWLILAAFEDNSVPQDLNAIFRIIMALPQRAVHYSLSELHILGDGKTKRSNNWDNLHESRLEKKKPKQMNGNFFIFRSLEDDSRNDKCNLIRNSNWIDGSRVVLPLISRALALRKKKLFSISLRWLRIFRQARRGKKLHNRLPSDSRLG